MTKQEVIDAIKSHGGSATTTQITTYLKSKGHSGYCSAVLQRLKKWHDVRLEKTKNIKGQKQNLWILQ